MKVDGQIKRNIFQQEDYHCFELNNVDGTILQVTGTLGAFCKHYTNNKSLKLSIYGKKINHPKYGQQFKLSLISIATDAKPSDFIELINTPFTKKAFISDALKDFTIWSSESYKVLNSICHELYTGPIAISHIKTIARHIKWMELCQCLSDIDSIDSMKIEQAFFSTPFSELNKILSDPYLLSIEKTIDFKTAELLGQGGVSTNRLTAAVLEIIRSHVSKTKSTVAPKSIVLEQAKKKYGITSIPDSKYIIPFSDDDDYLQDYLLAQTEIKIAAKIKQIINSESTSPVDFKKLNEAFDKAKFVPTSCQYKAIDVLKNKFSVITGLPGTGKTSLIKGLVDTLYNDNLAEFYLITPTGTSAMRMTEVTGFEAKTIHSVLGYNPSNETFIKNENNPLEADWIIIDESSMIDIYLFSSLLSAIPDNANVVLFGDIDQIASIKEGAILKDLFENLPSVRMTTTKRFDKDGIVKFCHSICNGEVLYNSLNGIKINITKSESELEIWVKQAVENMLNISKKQSFEKVQILAPQYAGKTGIDVINEHCRQHLYGDSPPIELSNGNKTYKFHIGSKVLIKTNMPDLGIFNGDIGFIDAFPGDKKKKFVELTIRKRKVTLTYNQARNMIPGYCISIHNAQGQEYPYCLTIITKKGAKLLSRNLINSAVSRGQKGVIIVAENGALETCAKTSDSNRKTRLTSLLNKDLTDNPRLKHV